MEAFLNLFSLNNAFKETLPSKFIFLLFNYAIEVG